MKQPEKLVKLFDIAGEPARREVRKELQLALAQATRLIEENYTTDDIHTGIIYRIGVEDSATRVSVEVYVLMQAIVIGCGLEAKWQRHQPL